MQRKATNKILSQLKLGHTVDLLRTLFSKVLVASRRVMQLYQ